MGRIRSPDICCRHAIRLSGGSILVVLAVDGLWWGELCRFLAQGRSGFQRVRQLRSPTRHRVLCAFPRFARLARLDPAARTDASASLGYLDRFGELSRDAGSDVWRLERGSPTTNGL